MFLLRDSSACAASASMAHLHYVHSLSPANRFSRLNPEFSSLETEILRAVFSWISIARGASIGSLRSLIWLAGWLVIVVVVVVVQRDPSSESVLQSCYLYLPTKLSGWPAGRLIWMPSLPKSGRQSDSTCEESFSWAVRRSLSLTTFSCRLCRYLVCA